MGCSGKATAWVAVVVAAAIAPGWACNKVCEPRETQECVCAGGAIGAQACNASGTGWSACDCGPVDSSTDAIADTAVDDAQEEDGTEAEPDCTRDEECDDGDPCTDDGCSAYGRCVHTGIDADRDGYFAATIEGSECGGTDCDDGRADVHPGATEASCTDGVDQDCEGPNVRMDAGAGILPIAGLAGDAARMAWTGSEFLVGSADGHLARLSDTGALLGSPIDLGFFAAGMAWTGTQLGVAGWMEDPVEGVVFARIDPTGALVGSVLALTSGASPAVEGPGTDLVWTGSEFLAVGFEWDGSAHVQGMYRLDADGNLLGEHCWDVPSPEIAGVKALWTGAEAAVFWSDLRAGPESIMLARITPEGGKPLEDQRLTTLELANLLSDVIWTGSEFGMSWRIVTGPEELPRFGRKDRYGAAVGLELSAGGQLAWTESELIILAPDFTYSRVSKDGALLVHAESAQVLPETTATKEIQVAWTGSAVGVVVPGEIAEPAFLLLRYCY